MNFGIGGCATIFQQSLFLVDWHIFHFNTTTSLETPTEYATAADMANDPKLPQPTSPQNPPPLNPISADSANGSRHTAIATATSYGAAGHVGNIYSCRIRPCRHQCNPQNTTSTTTDKCLHPITAVESTALVHQQYDATAKPSTNLTQQIYHQ